MTDDPAYDLFLSHASQQDGKRALSLCNALEAVGLRCFIAPRDMEPGEDWPTTLVRAIPRCRLLVLLLSQAALDSRFVPLEVERAGSRGIPIFPVRIEALKPDEKLEIFLSRTHWYDAFAHPWEQILPNLVECIAHRLRQPQPSPSTEASRLAFPNPLDSEACSPAAPRGETKRLVILYKRRAEPDGRLLRVLESGLSAAGHQIFVDRHLGMGVEWAREIETEIRAADAVVVLLSRLSVTSEMLQYEVEIAAKAAREHDGKPRLLPVRLGFEEPLPPELAPYLERLQYVLWQEPDDDAALFEGIVKALAEPPPRPAPLHPLERDTGAVPLDSKF
jgi:hypothetical protein